jgi:hypothetical protein
LGSKVREGALAAQPIEVADAPAPIDQVDRVLGVDGRQAGRSAA